VLQKTVAAVLVTLVAAVGFASSARAAPGSSGGDGEGGSTSLTQQLDAASRGYLEAKDKLAASKKKQTGLAAQLKLVDAAIGPAQAAFDQVVQESYRAGRLGPMSALLTADSSAGFLDRAEVLQTVAARQQKAMSELQKTRETQAAAKAAIDATVRDQQKQLAVMSSRKAQAEAALKTANAGQDDPQPGDGGGSAKASSVHRNADGSLSPEGCTVDDPTTSGCITPRMLHALNEAKSAGFTHYVACFRHQDSGEHPKGRACDFAADKGGFGGVASGSSKDYGNRLANYFINNSDELGVLYVIWFRRIWLPSSGWKAYTKGNGDPSSEHENHVHLSVR
jgi:septal ring factor EnvC (AmiA/AmiB activator)